MKFLKDFFFENVDFEKKADDDYLACKLSMITQMYLYNMCTILLLQTKQPQGDIGDSKTFKITPCNHVPGDLA